MSKVESAIDKCNHYTGGDNSLYLMFALKLFRGKLTPIISKQFFTELKKAFTRLIETDQKDTEEFKVIAKLVYFTLQAQSSLNIPKEKLLENSEDMTQFQEIADTFNPKSKGFNIKLYPFCIDQLT